MLVNAAWFTYGLSSGNSVIMAINGVVSVLCTANVLAHRAHSPVKPPAHLDGLALAGLLAWALLAASGYGRELSAVAVALGLVTGLPQLVNLLLHPSRSGGVAATTYLLGAVGSLAWSGYWGLQAQPVAAAGALYGAGVAATGLTLLRGRPVLARVLSQSSPSLHRGLRGGAARARVLLPAAA